MRPTLIASLLLGSCLIAHAEDAYVSQPPDRRRPGTTLRIELVGDSTQTDTAGYGRGFCANLTPIVDCLNMAKGGASTKTYREDGLWDRALSTRPDYMLIQFGHNDIESSEHLARQVTIEVYEQNLRRYVEEARAHGIKPVLVTPLTRRYFEKDGRVHSDLLGHAAVMRRVAADLQVPLIDLQAESIAYLDSIGEVEGTKLGITKKDADGKLGPDKTHLNWSGSYLFGRMVAVDLGRAVATLRKYVLKSPAPLPGEGAMAMRVMHGEPFKIVLVGDSTVATEGGWGPGFCAMLTSNVTCVDLGANGRSTVSYIDEGLWAKALAQNGNYYLIQFGHNDQKPDPKRHADASGLYAQNLERFIHDVRAIGGVPVLLSPLTRRTFKDGRLAEDGLKDYAAAARHVAAEAKVNFVDLLSLSQAYVNPMGQEQADTFDAETHPDAKAESTVSATKDRTHLNDKGKAVFGRMVADNVVRSQVELGPNVKGLPAGALPVLPSASPGHVSNKTITVGPTGKADFQSVQEAVDHAPVNGAVIRIGAGRYREKIHIATANIILVGTGALPQDVVLSWNDSAKSAGGTGKSGTVSVDADGFKAENLTIENTWELENTRSEEGSQAVALLMSSDRAVLDRVRLLGAQDTLYANSRTCHEDLPKNGTPPPPGRAACAASRQYFRDCFIEGHVDYIFGDAKAVFDHCELHARHNNNVMFTAQSRQFPEEDSGYYFLHSRITGDTQPGDKLVFGRPWRAYSTVLFYDTEIQPMLHADGWSEWNGKLKTSTYREYRSHGPGVNGIHRIVEYPPLSSAEEEKLTPRGLLSGADDWDPVRDANLLRALR